MGFDEQRIRADSVRLMRGAFLRSLWINYPGPTMQSVLRYVASDFGLSDGDLDKEFAYLEQRGWVRRDRVRIVGKNDVRLELTAAGVDVARGIDPANPLLAE